MINNFVFLTILIMSIFLLSYPQNEMIKIEIERIIRNKNHDDFLIGISTCNDRYVEESEEINEERGGKRTKRKRK